MNEAFETVKRFDKSEERGTYQLFSDTKVILGAGVELRGNGELADYIADDSLFRDTRGTEMGRSILFANGAEHIEICGEEGSVLNGMGHRWREGKRGKRPSLIRLVNCRHVVLRDLTLIDSACWCVHLQNCEDVVVDRVRISSRCNSNNDGLDLDCCRRVRVTNCTIDTGDDAIVLKATKNILSEDIHIENCTLRTHWAGFKIGTETVGDIRKVRFFNNRILLSEGGSVKLFSADGSNIDGVHIKDLVVSDGTGPICIANGSRMRRYFEGETREEPGSIKNIVIENMLAHVYVDERPNVAACRGVVFVSGSPERPIENLTIKNSAFLLPGGVREPMDFTVRELGEEYPEFYKLGTTPSHGAYLRHVRGARLENVDFFLKEEDMRPCLVLEDVTDFRKED